MSREPSTHAAQLLNASLRRFKFNSDDRLLAGGSSSACFTSAAQFHDQVRRPSLRRAALHAARASATSAHACSIRELRGQSIGGGALSSDEHDLGNLLLSRARSAATVLACYSSSQSLSQRSAASGHLHHLKLWRSTRRVESAYSASSTRSQRCTLRSFTAEAAPLDAIPSLRLGARRASASSAVPSYRLSRRTRALHFRWQSQ